ncbi:MAG TPA: hypothetical protein ENN60_00800, partial [archaeon]|nr:hypothetical protein [archaeon]
MAMDFSFSPGAENWNFIRPFNHVVVIGCSRYEDKEAHAIPKFLMDKGYQVHCVNPNAEMIFDHPVHHSLKEVPENFFEIVVAFRPSEEVEELARQLVEAGRVPGVFWMQEGIRNEKARKLLEARGVKVVEDACIAKVWAAGNIQRDELYMRVLKISGIYAKAKGFVLNPDPVRLDQVIAGLVANEASHGYRFCPCRTITGNLEEDKPKICPCKWHV